MDKLSLPIVILLLAVLGIGYYLGTQDRTAPTPQSTSTVSPPSSPAHQEDSGGTTARIPGAHHIHAIAYDADGNLLLGSHGGLFKSTDGGRTWRIMQIKGSINADDWMSIVPSPTDRKVIFAGGHDLGVIKSMDNGLTWMRSDDGIKGTDIHGLIINQRNPQLLFAYSVGNGVFRSVDGGISWKRMDDGPDNPGVRSLSYMAVQTGMDKSMGWDNWGLLFAGTADGLYQSFSCFCGWTKTTNVFDNTTVYTMATLQKDLRTLYAGTKDGVFKSADEGKTWAQLEGMRGLKVAAIAINPDTIQEVTAATEDGTVYRSQDAGATWNKTN